jgi:biotin carboxyl carrier protein
MRFEVSVTGRKHDLEITQVEGEWQCRIDGCEIRMNVARIADGTLSILQEGKSYVVRQGAGGAVVVDGRSYEVSIADPRSWRARQQAAAGVSGPLKLAAPMPGKVVRVLTSPGSTVVAGQGIVVIEAMKMQNEVRAPRDGIITAVLVQEGKAVNVGELVAILE